MNKIPYTYLIGWVNHNKWYYGVRYGKNCNPSDLWKTYFSSSKYVHEFRKTHGEPNIIQIRKTFNTEKEAVAWELKVLKKLNVLNNDMWLNKNIAGNFKSINPSKNPLKGKKYDEIYDIEKTKKWKKNISIKSKQYWNSEKGKIRKNQLKNERNELFTTKNREHVKKIKETFILKCEFCEKEVTLTKKKENTKKKTCGHKSCAAKWTMKYKKESYTSWWNSGKNHLNFTTSI